MKNPFHIRKRYLFLILLALGLSGGLIFLPDSSNSKELLPDKLMMELDDGTRFITTDQVADMIINQDPTLLLIDLRKPESYDKFSLEGAINIPFGKLLEKENKEYFGRTEMKKVFYGDRDFCSEQAWVLLRRAEYKNIFVMKGGLTEWVETIMKPTKPQEQVSEAQMELYNRRMAARGYFAGGSVEIRPGAYVADKGKVVKKKKKVKVIPKKVVVKEAEEEGC